MRKINIIFLLGCLTVLTVGGAGYYLLDRFQYLRHASALLDRARGAEVARDLKKAAKSLSQYLSIQREDGPTWAWYARIIDETTPADQPRDQVFLTYEQALRFNGEDGPGVKPEDRERRRTLQRRSAEVAMELGRHGDARKHLSALLEEVEADSQKQAEAADLEDLLGQCFRAEAKFDEAEKQFRGSIKHDPTRVATSDRLAHLLRSDLRNRESADEAIEETVAANPIAALAYVNRYRYNREFGQAADKNDIARALELDPDEADVLITAAELAQEGDDLATARKHLEHGLQKHPTNPVFYRISAGLDLAENRPDRAEAILRQGITAVPSNFDLKVRLTEALISQEKVDGDDGAIAWIDRLRKLGWDDGHVAYLDARVAMVKEQWSRAISKFDSARSLLASDQATIDRINLMLWECYGKTGQEEQQSAALKRAADGETLAKVARPLLAETMERSGRLDEAVSLHLKCVDTRPQSRVDLVRLLIRKNARLPKGQQRWDEVERRLLEAEKANPKAVEDLALLSADLLAAQGRVEEARTLLSTAQATNPMNLKCRVALARLAEIEKKDAEALKVLDQAEKDLGPSLAIFLARLDHWVQQGGPEAKTAVAKLAETRNQIPAADLPRVLDELAKAEGRLGEPTLARQYAREQSSLQPDNLEVLLGRFNLALAANDAAEALELVRMIREREGDQGTNWRFAQAAYLIHQAARGDARTLADARDLATQIAERRPGWWGGPLLKAKIAELQNQPEQALAGYMEAVNLGNRQPGSIRRLMGLLYERNRFDELDHLEQLIRDQGVAVKELTFVNAIKAMRKGDYNQGIGLVRQVFSDN